MNASCSSRDITGRAASDVPGHSGYDLAGLNLSTQPAIFVELGNMNNPQDAALAPQAGIREQLARSVDEGLTRFPAAG